MTPTDRIDVLSVRVDRLAMLTEFLREEALAVASRARFEDAISPDGLEAALSLIARIDAAADRLVDTLTQKRRTP